MSEDVLVLALVSRFQLVTSFLVSLRTHPKSVNMNLPVPLPAFLVSLSTEPEERSDELE